MLAIQTNADERGGVCALCHQLTRRPVGPALFLAGTEEPVCLTCGRTQEPELVVLLDLAGAATRYAGEWLEILGLPEAA